MELNIRGYPGYTVTDDGKIYSLNYNHTGIKKELVGYTDKDGYRVILIKNKQYPNGVKLKRYRIVAQHFIPNTLELPQVNHKDLCRHNDASYNLEWCTDMYNTQYANDMGSFDKFKKMITQTDVNGNTVNTFDSISQASRVTGINRVNISACINNKQNTAGGFKWVLSNDER